MVKTCARVAGSSPSADGSKATTSTPFCSRWRKLESSTSSISKMWKEVKEGDAEMEEDLERHKKAYLEEQDFLKRAELRSTGSRRRGWRETCAREATLRGDAGNNARCSNERTSSVVAWELSEASAGVLGGRGCQRLFFNTPAVSASSSASRVFVGSGVVEATKAHEAGTCDHACAHERERDGAMSRRVVIRPGGDARRRGPRRA